MDKKIYSNLTVSSSPHIVSNTDTTRIMLMVLIALAPSFVMSIYVFGPRVIALTLVCLVSCMFFEWAYNKLMKKPQTVGDLSAAVAGDEGKSLINLPILRYIGRNSLPHSVRQCTSSTTTVCTLFF